jgi:hypothetical protein
VRGCIPLFSIAFTLVAAAVCARRMLRGDGRGGGGGGAGVAAPGAGGCGMQQPVVVQHGRSRERGGGDSGPGVVGDLEGAEERDPVVSPPLSPTVREPNLK